MAVFSSALLATALAAPAVAGVFTGQAARRQQKQALQQQAAAQSQAESQALRQRRQAEQDAKAAAEQQPDIMSILLGAQRAAGKGTASTILSRGTPFGGQTPLGG